MEGFGNPSSLFLRLVLVPQLVADLPSQLLDRNLRLEHPADLLPPIRLQPLHLPFHLILPRRARRIHQVHLALRRRQLRLQRLQVRLDVVIRQQPGVLARAVQQLQVLVARREVRGRHVGALERRPQRVGVQRAVVVGLFLGFVAGEVERLQGRLRGDALELGGERGREGGCAAGGGEKGERGGRGGGGGEFGVDEGACGGEGFGGRLWVNVWAEEVSIMR